MPPGPPLDAAIRAEQHAGTGPPPWPQLDPAALRKDFPLLSRTVKPWPGLVDVEAMPGDGEDAEGGDGA